MLLVENSVLSRVSTAALRADAREYSASAWYYIGLGYEFSSSV